MNLSKIVGLVLCGILFGCSASVQERQYTLQVDIRNANPGWCYLYRLSFEQDPVCVDSFQIETLDQQFERSIPATEEPSIYQLTVVPVRTSFYIVGDAPKVSLRINATDPQAYTTAGSPGSALFQRIQHIQRGRTDSLYVLNNKIQNGMGDAAVHRVVMDTLRARMNRDFLSFADTCASPLVTLFISQQIDFGKNVDRHKAFIAGLAQRFPEHQEIQGSIQKMRDYFSLLDIEYQKGDRLPLASFTDIQGQTVSTADWKHRMYLLEFWTAYCPTCLESLLQKKEIYQNFHAKGFEMLAFSLDEDRRLFDDTQQRAGFPWPVVADFKGWSGHAAQTYKIDSIPFNILVGSDGRVVEKNIDPKRLVLILENWKGASQ